MGKLNGGEGGSYGVCVCVSHIKANEKYCHFQSKFIHGTFMFQQTDVSVCVHWLGSMCIERG